MSVKPRSAGRPSGSVNCAIRLAAIPAPIAPPIVRMTVFMPVAIPVWSRETASTIRFAIDANAKPIPTPSRAIATYTSICSSCLKVRSTNEASVTAAPAISGTREPTVFESRPPIGLKIIIVIVSGSRKSPPSVTEAPKP